MRRKRVLSQKRPAAGGEARELLSCYRVIRGVPVRVCEDASSLQDGGQGFSVLVRECALGFNTAANV